MPSVSLSEDLTCFMGNFMFRVTFHLELMKIQVCDNRWRAEPLMFSDLVAMTTPLVNKLTTFKELLS